MAWDGQAGQVGELAGVVAREVLAGFRAEVHGCFTRRGDALLELGDAVLCAAGRVGDLAHLSLEPEFGRGHGALFAALNAGRVEVARLRRAVAGLVLPRWRGRGICLAVDGTAWLRPDAVTSPERMYCPVPGRGKRAGQVTPGWPYSVVAALGPGASSWVVVLDAVRLGPADDACAVTADQIREVIGRLIAAGQWRAGDPPVLIVLDAGYNPSRLQHLLADLPVLLVVRLRSTRVFYRTPPPKQYGEPGRPRRHGAPLRCQDPSTWDGAALSTAPHPRHGELAVRAWAWLHQRLDRHCGGWDDWPPGQELPVIEGSVIRLEPPRRRGGPGPMWLWCSDGAARPQTVAAAWQAYLRRFDIEHAFRFLKHTLGWDKPLLRDPAAADRWTWLLLACYNQLWLARPLAGAGMPWHPPRPATPLSPGRVRQGFRHLHATLPVLASPAKPARPGPGRPKGSKNKTKAARHPVGKTTPETRHRTKNRAKRPNRTG